MPKLSRKDAELRGALEPAMAGPVLPRHGAASLGEPQQVVAWIADRAIPAASNSAISLHELHADYVTWCVDARGGPLALMPFEQGLDAARRLPELVGKIRKFGDRYYGIGLKDSETKILSSPRRVRGKSA